MKSKNNYHAPANISFNAKYLKELVAEWQEGCRTSISYIFFFFYFTLSDFESLTTDTCGSVNSRAVLATYALATLDCRHMAASMHPSSRVTAEPLMFSAASSCCSILRCLCLNCVPFSAAIHTYQLFDLWLTRFCAIFATFFDFSFLLLFCFFFFVYLFVVVGAGLSMDKCKLWDLRHSITVFCRDLCT